MNAQGILNPAESDSVPSPLAIDLDWDAYFENFKDVHGEPVIHKDRILFQDGWAYNSRDKMGPEYPPPQDRQELHRLKTIYWLTRLNIVTTEYHALRDIIQGLRELQRTHSLPLQHSSIAYDEENGSKRITQSLNLEEIEHGRLAWLSQDMEDCKEQLQQLQEQLQ